MSSPQAWHQRPDESNEAWGKFMRWVQADPRPAALTQFGNLPTKYEWAQRALAYDRTLEREAKGPSPAKDLKESLVGLMSLASLEINKLLASSQQSLGNALSAKEILAIVAYLGSNRDELMKLIQDQGEVDLTDVSDEDIEKLLELQQKLGHG